MSKWIVTDHLDPAIKLSLEKLDRQVDWMPDISMQELLDRIGGYEGMVISSKTTVDKRLIDRATSLRIVARAGSGMEHVDRDYCQTKGIICFSSPEGNRNAVAEHAFGMLLTLTNHLRRAHFELTQGIWRREENRGFELKGRTIGIIGYGHTGSTFATKFSGWGVKLLAYDKYKSGFGSDLVAESRYEQILEEADAISFHVPLNSEARHWINADFIEKCKEGVILLNTSRGGVLHTKETVEALRNGRIGGLGIDVFEDEPLQKAQVNDYAIYEELISFENVIATPHIAGWTKESKVQLVEILAGKIKAELIKQGAI